MIERETKTYLTLSQQSGWKVDNLAMEISAEIKIKTNIEKKLKGKLAELNAVTVAYREALQTSLSLNTETIQSFVEYQSAIEGELEIIRKDLSTIEQSINKLRSTITDEHMRKKFLDSKVKDCRERDQKLIDKKIDQELEDLYLLNLV